MHCLLKAVLVCVLCTQTASSADACGKNIVPDCTVPTEAEVCQISYTTDDEGKATSLKCEWNGTVCKDGFPCDLVPTPEPAHTNTTAPADDSGSSDGGMSFGVKFMIFLLTYGVTILALIFGIRYARPHICGTSKMEEATGFLKRATGTGSKK